MPGGGGGCLVPDGGGPEVEACRVPGPRLLPVVPVGGGTGFPWAWILADLRIVAAADASVGTQSWYLILVLGHFHLGTVMFT